MVIFPFPLDFPYCLILLYFLKEIKIKSTELKTKPGKLPTKAFSAMSVWKNFPTVSCNAIKLIRIQEQNKTTAETAEGKSDNLINFQLCKGIFPHIISMVHL